MDCGESYYLERQGIVNTFRQESNQKLHCRLHFVTSANPLNQRVLLAAPDSLPSIDIRPARFHVVRWPQLNIGPPENLADLDEAIENLYGYDWIIFVNPDAVRFFQACLARLGHEVANLDALRVCAAHEEAAMVLEEAHVHVDLVATQTNPSAVVGQLTAFAGEGDSLDRLNFLLPQAAIGRDYLKPHLEAKGARADVVVAYQTVASADLTRLAGIDGMLRTGSIDAVIFANAAEVSELARVFDRTDLYGQFETTAVFTLDPVTTKAARDAGVSRPLQCAEPNERGIIESLAKHFEG